MITIRESILMQAKPEQVWAVLSNPYEVVRCLPDAEVLTANDDGTYKGLITIKFGPMRIKFIALVDLELDEPELQGRITAKGQDANGGTRMKTVADFHVNQDGANGDTIVDLNGSVHLSGRMADQIEAAAGAVVKRMSGDFVEALALRLGEPESESSPEPEIAHGWFSRNLVRVGRWLRSRTRWHGRGN